MGRARSGRPDDDRSTAESARILEGVSRDSEALGSSSLARTGRRVADHFGGADAVGQAGHGETDPVEVWGRRVGRVLSLLLGVVLTWWLGAQLGWW